MCIVHVEFFLSLFVTDTLKLTASIFYFPIGGKKKGIFDLLKDELFFV